MRQLSRAPKGKPKLSLAEKIEMDVPISIKEASVMLGKAQSTIYYWISLGKLPYSRKHGSMMLPSKIREAIARSSTRA